jgi:hypothetical protein
VPARACAQHPCTHSHPTYRFCTFGQTDGGKNFVEPTAIICGQVEGKEDVSGLPLG